MNTGYINLCISVPSTFRTNVKLPIPVLKGVNLPEFCSCLEAVNFTTGEVDLQDESKGLSLCYIEKSLRLQSLCFG